MSRLRRPALCCPEFPNYARGLCMAHYKAARRQMETTDQTEARRVRQRQYNRDKHGYGARVLP